jgi:hypothetical protein
MIEVDYLDSLYTNYRRSPWRLCSPHASPIVYSSKQGFKLGTYLARLIRGDVGRAVPITGWPTSLATACHWSLMVKELMTLHTARTAPAVPAVQSLSAAANPWFLGQARRNGENVDRNGLGPGKPYLGEVGEPEDGGFAVIILRTGYGPEDEAHRSG